MKTLQAICLLALSKGVLSTLVQEPLGFEPSFDQVVAHESDSSPPPKQRSPSFQDPFEAPATGGGRDPWVLNLLQLTGEGDDEENEVTDVEEDAPGFPVVHLDYVSHRATTYHVSIIDIVLIRFSSDPVIEKRRLLRLQKHSLCCSSHWRASIRCSTAPPCAGRNPDRLQGPFMCSGNSRLDLERDESSMGDKERSIWWYK